MKVKRDETGVVIIACLSAIVSMPIVFLFNAWVISIGWAWFVVPLGVPALSFWQAAGFGIIVTYLTTKAKIPDETKEKSPREHIGAIVNAIGISITRPAFTLFFMWLVHVIEARA